MAWTMAGCAPAPQAPRTERPPIAAPTWPDAHRVTWVDLVAEGRGEAAWYAATEWALAPASWVVPRVGGVPPAGFGQVLDEGARTWTLRRLEDGLEVCGAWGGCTEHPDLEGALLRMDLTAAPAPLTLSAAEVRDAATLYGLGPAGRRARGESTPGGLWIRARRQLAGGAPGRAVVQLERALARDPSNPALRAALAQAFGDAGRGAEARSQWLALVADEPFDPRFEAACARVERAAGRRADAVARVRALPPRFRKLPAASEVLQAAAQAEAEEAQGEGRTRSIPGAAALRSGRPAPEEIIRSLRRSRDPIAAVARGEAKLALGNARGALRDAAAALRGTPWLPEALTLRAAALDGLGRHEDAGEARADLRYADPGSAEGPRRLPTARNVPIQSPD